MADDPFGIPEFLKIPQSERKAAWDKHRQAAKPLPAEPAPRRITDLPGEPPHEDDA